MRKENAMTRKDDHDEPATTSDQSDDETQLDAPRCDIDWQDGRLVVTCETAEDRDRMAALMEHAEIVVGASTGEPDPKPQSEPPHTGD